MQYRANYTNHAADVHRSTRWYDSRQAAQDALMKNRDVGHFAYLGHVAGDVFEHGWCTNGPRNGGLVDLDVRDSGLTP
jgi:hypothetical protein